MVIALVFAQKTTRLAVLAALAFGALLLPAQPSGAKAMNSGATPQMTRFAGRLGSEDAIYDPQSMGVFDQITHIAYVEDDPAITDPRLKGRWLVADREGLKAVAQVDGRIQTLTLPDTAKRITAIATRGPDSDPTNRLQVVYAEFIDGDSPRSVLWAIDVDGTQHKLLVSRPDPDLGEDPPWGNLVWVTGLAISKGGTVTVQDAAKSSCIFVRPGGSTMGGVRRRIDVSAAEARIAADLPYPLLDNRVVATDPSRGTQYGLEADFYYSDDGTSTVFCDLEPRLAARLKGSGQPMAVGGAQPISLAAYGDSLFVVDKARNEIWVIDLKTQNYNLLVGHASNGAVNRIGPLHYFVRHLLPSTCAALVPVDMAISSGGRCMVATVNGIVQLDLGTLAVTKAGVPVVSQSPGGSSSSAQPAVGAVIPGMASGEAAAGKVNGPRWSYLPKFNEVALDALLSKGVTRAEYLEPGLASPSLEGAILLAALLYARDEQRAARLLDIMFKDATINWNNPRLLFPNDEQLHSVLQYAISNECYLIAKKLLIHNKKLNVYDVKSIIPNPGEGLWQISILLHLFQANELDLANIVVERYKQEPAYFDQLIGNNSGERLRDFFEKKSVIARCSSTSAGQALLDGIRAAVLSGKERQAASPASMVTLYAGRIGEGEAEGELASKAAFDGIFNLAYVEADPRYPGGYLSGHWLVVDKGGIKAVTKEGSSVQVVPLPSLPRGGVTAIATRPLGSAQDNLLQVVFAERLPGLMPRSAIWAIDRAGKQYQLAGPASPVTDYLGLVTCLEICRDGSVLVMDSTRQVLLRLTAGGVALVARVPGDSWWVGPGGGLARLPLVSFCHTETGTLLLAFYDGIAELVSDNVADWLLGAGGKAGFVNSLFSPMPYLVPCLRAPASLKAVGDLLFILEPSNKAIRVFNLKTRVLASLVGDPSNGGVNRLGPQAFSNAHLPPAACAALVPTAMAWASDGRLMAATANGLLEVGLFPSEAVKDSAITPALEQGGSASSGGPVKIAAGPKPVSLWQAIEGAAIPYDPGAVALFLKANGAALPVDEVYQGESKSLKGAIPLMVVLAKGDLKNANKIIDIMERNKSKNWNVASNICRWSNKSGGYTALHFALELDDHDIIKRLVAVPEVDTNIRFKGHVLVSYETIYDDIVVDVFNKNRTTDGYLDQIIDVKRYNEKIRNYYKRKDVIANRQATEGGKKILAAFKSVELAEKYRKRKEKGKIVNENNIKIKPEPLVQAEGNERSALEERIRPEPRPVEQSWHDLYDSQLKSALNNSNFDLTYKKLNEIRSAVSAFSIRLENSKSIIGEPLFLKYKSSNKKFNQYLEDIGAMDRFLASQEANLEQLQKDKQAIETSVDLRDYPSMAAASEAIHGLSARIAKLQESIEEKGRYLELRAKFIDNAINSLRKNLPAAPKGAVVPALAEVAGAPRSGSGAPVLPEVAAVPPVPEAAKAPPSPEPAAKAPPLPEPTRKLSPKAGPTKPAKAPEQKGAGSEASSSSVFSPRPKAPAPALSLYGQLGLGNRSAIPELLVLESLLAIDSFEEGVLREMELYALLGSCARVMEQIKNSPSCHLLSPGLAEDFRNLLFHEPACNYDLLELKGFAKKLDEYCKSMEFKPYRQDAAFEHPFLASVLSVAPPELNSAQLLNALQSLEARYKVIQKYSPQDQAEATFKARASGFLEAKLGVFCSTILVRIKAGSSSVTLAQAAELKALREALPRTFDKFIDQGKAFRHKDYAPLAEVAWGRGPGPWVQKKRVPWVDVVVPKAPTSADSAVPEGPAVRTPEPDDEDILGKLNLEALHRLDSLSPDARASVCRSARRWLKTAYYLPGSESAAISDKVLEFASLYQKSSSPLALPPDSVPLPGPVGLPEDSSEAPASSAPSQAGGSMAARPKRLAPKPALTAEEEESLEYLFLADQHITSREELHPWTEKLWRRRHLRALSVSSCVLNGHEDELFDSISALDGLETLILHDTDLGSGGLDYLLETLHKNSSTLAILELSAMRLGGEDGVRLLSRLALLGAPALECLILSQNPLGTVACGQALRDLILKEHALRYLNLRGCAIDDKFIEQVGTALASKPSIETLDLADNVIGQGGCLWLAQVIEQNRTLKDLDLSGNPLSEAGFKLLLAAAGRSVSLEAVHLWSKDPLSASYQREMDQVLSSRPGAGPVRLSSAAKEYVPGAVKPLKPRAYIPACDNPRLVELRDPELAGMTESLSLTRTQFSSKYPYVELENLFNTAKMLTSFSVTKCVVLDGGSDFLHAILHLNSLKDISIQSLKMNPNNRFQILSALLLNNPKLETIRLSTGLTPREFAEVMRIIISNHVSSLKKLDYSGNDVGHGRTAKSVSDLLTGNRTLTTLMLNRCDVRDRFVAFFRKALNYNATLETLGLADNLITDQGGLELALALKENRTLKHLDLAGNLLSKQALDQILEALKVNRTLETISLVSARPWSARYQEEADRILKGHRSPGHFLEGQ